MIVPHAASTSAVGNAMNNSVAVIAPSFGPAIITIFGVDVPVLALSLSVAGLVMARIIAPPPARKLTQAQNMVLTAMLLIVLFLVVTGELFGTKPLGVGMAFVWAVGLGFSGLLVIEFFGQRVMDSLKILIGYSANRPKDND